MTDKHHNYPTWAKSAEVVDSEESLGVFISEEDVTCGVAEDGRNCAFGRAAIRAMGGQGRAYFYKTVALIQPDANEPLVIRFRVPVKAQRQVIIPLDEGRREDVIPGIYTLTPPTPHNRLGAVHRATVNKRGPYRTQRAHGVGHYLSPRILTALKQNYEKESK